MNTKQNKITASFKFSDIYGPHKLMLVSGVLMALFGLILAVTGGISYRNYAASFDSIDGAKNTFAILGDDIGRFGSENESQTVPLLKSTKISNEIFARNGDLFLIGSGSSYANFRQVWQMFATSALALERTSSDIEGLKFALKDESVRLQSLAKKTEGFRQNVQFLESVSRLLSYSATSFGSSMIPRIEYDIKMIAYVSTQLTDSGMSEWRAASVESKGISDRILPLVSAVKSSAPTQEVFTNIINSAMNAKDALHKVTIALSSSESTSIQLAISGLMLLVCGASLFLFAFSAAIKEFGTRFNKGSSLFRKNEVHLSEIINAFRSICDGDLNIKIGDIGEGKISEIADLLNELSFSIKRAFDGVSVSVETFAAGSKMAQGFTASSSQIAQKQQIYLSDVHNQLLIVFDLITSISSDAESTSFAARSAVDAAQKSTRAVVDSAESMQGIRNTIQETSKRIKRLGERSQEIGEISALLSNFSEQINVLALNAALEAERAGEHGRGFAMVAAEVRKLSTRTEESLKKISPLITGIQGDTRDAIEAMERSTNMVVDGAYSAELASSSLETIKALSDTLIGMINAILGGSAEQASKLQKVTSVVSDAYHLNVELVSQIEKTESSVQAIGNRSRELARRTMQEYGEHA